MEDKTVQVVTQIFSGLREVEERVDEVQVETHSIQVPLLEPMLVEDARRYITENWDKGVPCPCCGQRVQRYARPITSSMAWGLCRLYEHLQENLGEEWIHVERFFNSCPDIPCSFRGDFAKLRYWGLIEMLDERREDGSPNNGYWRLTSRGIAFVRGDISVASHVYLYDGHALSFSDDHVTIRDSLKNKFDYDSLLEGNL
jgi:hypothetical protein